MYNHSGFSESRKKKKIHTSLIAATACTQEKLAETLLKNRKHKEAEEVYRRLISLGVANHISYVNLALICGMSGRFDENLDLLKKALEINPNHANTYNLLGLELCRLNEISQAIAAYEKAIALQPNLWNAYLNLANLLSEQSRYDEAIPIYQNLVENNPNFQEVHLQLGFALLEKRELDAALLSLEKSLEIKSDCAKTFFNLGFLYKLKGDLCLSIRYFEESVKLNPNHSVAQAAFSLVLLLAGNYELGLEKYEFRSNDPNYTKPIALPSCEFWNGRKLTFDDQLIVVCEQGIGDTFQFMRYVFHMKKQGYNVSLCVYTKLAAVISLSCPELPLLTPEEANEMNDNYWIPMLSLPRQLGVCPENPIVSDPYIRIKDSLILEWKHKLTNNGAKSKDNLIVAINWQGNPSTETNQLRGRSLPLETFSTLASCENVSFLSLQKGFGSEQLESCSFRDKFISCQDQISESWDFLDTGAIIANCNLVVTSDTAVAHLAGGMGKETWLLLQYVPDWRWGMEGDTSFWYPSMRIFRQKESGNWSEVLNQVAKELYVFVSMHKQTIP